MDVQPLYLVHAKRSQAMVILATGIQVLNKLQYKLPLVVVVIAGDHSPWPLVGGK